MRYAAALLAWFTSTVISAQGPPATDIYVAELKDLENTTELTGLRNITDRDGYDNQPSFRNGHQLFYTAIDGSGQADIFQFDLSTGERTQVVQTEESEYSPTLMPDGTGISVVRVEKDGTQRLWRFPLDGGEPQLLLEDVKPVGYHLWLGPKKLAFFILGEPNTLQLATLGESGTKTVFPEPGRSFQRIPGNNRFSAIRKAGEGNWLIESVDPETLQHDVLIKTRPGSEDHVWQPDGTLLMAEGTQLFRWHSERDKDWVLLADLGGQGLKKITRIAVSPDNRRIALVNDR